MLNEFIKRKQKKKETIVLVLIMVFLIVQNAFPQLALSVRIENYGPHTVKRALLSSQTSEWVSVDISASRPESADIALVKSSTPLPLALTGIPPNTAWFICSWVDCPNGESDVKAPQVPLFLRKAGSVYHLLTEDGRSGVVEDEEKRSCLILKLVDEKNPVDFILVDQ